jgi:hypothetical protein
MVIERQPAVIAVCRIFGNLPAGSSVEAGPARRIQWQPSDTAWGRSRNEAKETTMELRKITTAIALISAIACSSALAGTSDDEILANCDYPQASAQVPNEPGLADYLANCDFPEPHSTVTRSAGERSFEDYFANCDYPEPQSPVTRSASERSFEDYIANCDFPEPHSTVTPSAGDAYELLANCDHPDSV